MSQISRKWLEDGAVNPQKMTIDATVNMNGYALTNLPSPTDASHAVTLGYFDSYQKAFSWKEEVATTADRDATYGNEDISGIYGPPVDGWMVWVMNENITYAFREDADATGWIKAGQTPTVPTASDTTMGKMYLANNNSWTYDDASALRSNDSRLWRYDAAGVGIHGVDGDATVGGELSVGKVTGVTTSVGKIYVGHHNDIRNYSTSGDSLRLYGYQNLDMSAGNRSINLSADNDINMTPGFGSPPGSGHVYIEDSDVSPLNDGTGTLGSASHRWDTLYLDSTIDTNGLTIIGDTTFVNDIYFSDSTDNYIKSSASQLNVHAHGSGSGGNITIADDININSGISQTRYISLRGITQVYGALQATQDSTFTGTATFDGVTTLNDDVYIPGEIHSDATIYDSLLTRTSAPVKFRNATNNIYSPSTDELQMSVPAVQINLHGTVDGTATITCAGSNGVLNINADTTVSSDFEVTGNTTLTNNVILGGDLDVLSGRSSSKILNIGDSTALQITGNKIIPTRSHHSLVVQGTAHDDLDTIENVGPEEGDILVLSPPAAAYNVTVKSGAGNILLHNGADRVLIGNTHTHARLTLVFCNDGSWNELSFSDNS